MARVPSTPKLRDEYPVDQPSARIGGSPRSSRAQVLQFGKSLGNEAEAGAQGEGSSEPASIDFLRKIATRGGDISDLLAPGLVDEIGIRAEREWQIDCGSRDHWLKVAKKGLDLAAQDSDENEETGDYGPWEGASDVHYPILTQGAQEFNARALPELVKGDKAVGVKVFSPPAQSPSPAQIAQQGPQPPQPPQGDPQAQAAAQQAMQADQQAQGMAELQMKARQARAERVAHYMNWLIFYEMDDWEGETDLLLLESSITGMGFRKVYMGTTSLCSDYVSALRLTVNNATKNLARCPRITQDFDIYPNEIEEGKRSGRYRDVDLDETGDDPEEPRLWLEQHRLEDLDGDGLGEPYIVTVDVKTKRTMRIEAGFTEADIFQKAGRVTRIERWQPFAPYQFLLDPKGRFYGLGLARLLDAITDSVDTTLNQLVDAGNAEIAGGGFIGSNVRLQGSGQGGALWFRPGEYQVVSTPGPNLQESIWERTTPHPSPVAFQMLELLLAAAKDLASVKDVISGDAPSTAPVGTTLALQNQALQVFSSIYKRIYRGFKAEFQLQFKALKRWATPEMKAKYVELTGGDFDSDFDSDGTDIQPVADPTVVTKMQKIAKMQTMIQVAETPVGMAAGMQMPGPAQALIGDFLDIIDVDRPERFVAAVPPNPEMLAKVQELAAAAALKGAQAQHTGAKTALDQAKIGSDHAAANLDMAKTVEIMGKVGEQTHQLHVEAHRVATQGIQPPPEGTGTDGGASAT